MVTLLCMYLHVHKCMNMQCEVRGESLGFISECFISGTIQLALGDRVSDWPASSARPAGRKAQQEGHKCASSAGGPQVCKLSRKVTSVYDTPSFFYMGLGD